MSESEPEPLISTIPSRIFIVPYRNRTEHKVFFCKYMKFILEDMDPGDYEVYFSHQCDIRSFNRGAVKNIGFLAMKAKYPNDYKNMTFIFNDIDTMPYHKLFDYTARPGVVKHYYGFKYALGGIVAINGSDFERINGFPNFWGWGMEDNVLQKRCELNRIIIDRTNFYPIGSHEMLQLFDGVSRIISKKDPWRATHDNGIDGLHTIHLLKYTVDRDSANPKDNIFKEENFHSYFINISTFMTGYNHDGENYADYDLRDPLRKITHPSKFGAPTPSNSSVGINVDDWTNIPKRVHFAENNVDQMVQKEMQGLRQAHSARPNQVRPQSVAPSLNKPTGNQMGHVSRANVFPFSKRR
jgi:hypothetical protein